ncbi:nitrile hydratase subunit beta [soil metagenome]
MNGVHDMGGMHGFGPMVIDDDEHLFHAPWEARVRSMVMLSIAQGHFTADASRYGIEQMAPAVQLNAPYFERWLASLEFNLVSEGNISVGELEERIEVLRENPLFTVEPKAPLRASNPPRAGNLDGLDGVSANPRFWVGDEVIARTINPPGHTRLPRYARGKRGTINRVHGTFTFADTNAHGLGPQPQTVYSVAFDGRELWGDSAEKNQVVSLDLWESYLEPPPAE